MDDFHMFTDKLCLDWWRHVAFRRYYDTFYAMSVVLNFFLLNFYFYSIIGVVRGFQMTQNLYYYTLQNGDIIGSRGPYV